MTNKTDLVSIQRRVDHDKVLLSSINTDDVVTGVSVNDRGCAAAAHPHHLMTATTQTITNIFNTGHFDSVTS